MNRRGLAPRTARGWEEFNAAITGLLWPLVFRFVSYRFPAVVRRLPYRECSYSSFIKQARRYVKTPRKFELWHLRMLSARCGDYRRDQGTRPPNILIGSGLGSAPRPPFPHHSEEIATTTQCIRMSQTRARSEIANLLRWHAIYDIPAPGSVFRLRMRIYYIARVETLFKIDYPGPQNFFYLIIWLYLSASEGIIRRRYFMQAMHLPLSRLFICQLTGNLTWHNVYNRPTRAFQFAIRIDSIRFVVRIDANRFVFLKIGLSIH